MSNKLSSNTARLQSILEAVNNLPNGAEGDTNTSDATATSAEIFKDKTAYISSGKVTGTFTIDEELTTQDGLITQIQNAVDNLPEAKEEPILQDKTVTPTVNSQIIVADSGYDGLSKVTIKGDGNLVASNIKSGVSIFGINGNYEGNGSGGGSSGSVDTCNLTINGDFQFIYSDISSSNIVGTSIIAPQNEVLIVPCSSLIVVYDYRMATGIANPVQASNIEVIHDGTTNYELISVFQVSRIANSNCSLIF